ncbi:MAG TPA: response regulator transcription factor [Verrucomicrobia bacterium]|nr:response regulator transcription factor [Verrucomicrobiota bacterium]HOB31990.1 response regulator transcription factor [Verrucomicrobiota bacterium]HOP97615.1 response regulator transcription factor [Verrucomicrobiota bacterium]
MNISVSIVEDDGEVRASLAHLINRSPGYRCVSAHASAEEALRELPRVKPDVVLMDINLTGLNGVECVRRLKPVLPATQIIMLTVYQNTENIFNALASGATGYLLKQTPPDELLAAIREVHEGGSPMSSHIARKIVQSFQQPAPAAQEAENLSPREAQVLELLAKGFLYKEIADTMKVSYATVHTHIRHIYEKLHVRSRTEAVAKHLSKTRIPARIGVPPQGVMGR